MLRLVRIIRIARVVKIARQNKEIMLVFSGIVEAMRSAVWVSFILVATIYVAAIFCVNTMGGENLKHFPGYTQDMDSVNEMDIIMEFNPYIRFGTMRNSMMTLFNLAIQAEFSEIVWPLLLHQPVFVPFLLLFTVMVTYGMMNLIIGLVVESVIGNAKAYDQEAAGLKAHMKKKALESITKAMQQIVSSSGSLSADVISEADGSDMRLMRKLIQAMGLPGYFTPFHLLELLDENGNGTIDEEELIEGTARLVDALDVNDPFQHMCILQRSIHVLKAEVYQHQACVEKAIQKGFEDLTARLCTTSETTLREACKAAPPMELPSIVGTALQPLREVLEQAQDKLQAVTTLVETARHEESLLSTGPDGPLLGPEALHAQHLVVAGRTARTESHVHEGRNNRLTNSNSYQAREVSNGTHSGAWRESVPGHGEGGVATEEQAAKEEVVLCDRMRL
jgi:hypothetical protein